MARSRKSPKTEPAEIPLDPPTPVSEVLESLKERYDLKPASQLPTQLDPPEMTHAQAVLARRMQPAPEGFKGVASFPPAGVRVNRGIDRNTGIAALQFAESKPLSRATEYDLMTTIQEKGFQFKTATRQWERPASGTSAGENTLDAVRLGQEIADARNVGRGR